MPAATTASEVSVSTAPPKPVEVPAFVALDAAQAQLVYVWCADPGRVNGVTCEIIADIRRKVRESGLVPAAVVAAIDAPRE